MDFTASNPRPLKTEFVHDGMTHTQIKRAANVAIFQVGSINPGFEVVLLRIAKPQKLPGNGGMAPWRWSYPSTGEFGSRGWYYPTLEAAETKFNELIHT